MSSERAELTRLIASAIKGNDGVAAEDNAVKLAKCIVETTNQISIHELEVEKLGGKKRSIKDGPGSKEQKTKKLKPVTEDIKQRKKLVTTLKKTLDLQRLELEKMNGDEGNESDDSNGSDESSVVSSL